MLSKVEMGFDDYKKTPSSIYSQSIFFRFGRCVRYGNNIGGKLSCLAALRRNEMQLANDWMKFAHLVSDEIVEVVQALFEFTGESPRKLFGGNGRSALPTPDLRGRPAAKRARMDGSELFPGSQ